MPSVNPKVFISYSWSNDEHNEKIREWAENLRRNGVDFVMDVFDLKEGDDRYAFMERMIADESITHVLVFCDSLYAAKADRKKHSSGVGAESQIISSELYSKSVQSKFIPIYCEQSETGEYCQPIFLKSRFGLDFTTAEKMAENWERLLRLLFNKPLYTKPSLGTPPAFIASPTNNPDTQITLKYNFLKQAIIGEKTTVPIYRDDFFSVCLSEVDKLRTRTPPNMELYPQQILDTFRDLAHIRNSLIDWLLLEGKIITASQLSEILLDLLEKMLFLKSRPNEVNSWDESYFLAHKLFVYDFFLYTVEALLTLRKYDVLHNIYHNAYRSPKNETINSDFCSYRSFWAESNDILQSSLNPTPGTKYNSPVNELLKRYANRSDIPFSRLAEADMLCMLMYFLVQEQEAMEYWYPHTVNVGYRGSYCDDFFVRSKRHDFFRHLAVITGIPTGNELRVAVKKKLESLQSHNFWSRCRHFSDSWSLLKLDTLDTIV